MAHQVTTNQMTMPASANIAENGRSLRAWPKINAPAARFATSESLSAISTRCAVLKINIVDLESESDARARESQSRDKSAGRAYPSQILPCRTLSLIV